MLIRQIEMRRAGEHNENNRKIKQNGNDLATTKWAQLRTGINN